MNDAQAIEIALAETMRAHAAIGAGVALRPWQSLRAYATGKSIARVFPCLDIRCTPPALDESQATHNCAASIMAGTLADADADHAIVSALYEAAQGTCERLFAQQRGSGGAEIDTFTASLAENAANIRLGGFTFDMGFAPYDEDGVNMIGITFRVHYSRADM